VTSDARRKMIESAVTLLAMRGLQGTAFSDVLERSGAPRGSIYHHFPQGKDQLIDAAIDLAGERTLHVLDAVEGASPTAITTYFLDLWREVLVRSNFRAGCSVLAVTVAADSPALLEHATAIFRAWQARLADLYVAAGVDPGMASSFATMLIAASEGAVVLSRAQRSLEPFDQVAARLVDTTP
jgi:TetR/AcrR family transcriptional repressor of lmrAB and yxaGH operons